jgi:hypothetical protein
MFMNLPDALPTDAAVAAVKTLGGKWIAGLVPNEPIQRGPDLKCDIGDATFEAARNHWQTFDAEDRYRYMSGALASLSFDISDLATA